jgi:hypothetical protein
VWTGRGSCTVFGTKCPTSARSCATSMLRTSAVGHASTRRVVGDHRRSARGNTSSRCSLRRSPGSVDNTWTPREAPGVQSSRPSPAFGRARFGATSCRRWLSTPFGAVGSVMSLWPRPGAPCERGRVVLLRNRPPLAAARVASARKCEQELIRKAAQAARASNRRTAEPFSDLRLNRSIALELNRWNR